MKNKISLINLAKGTALAFFLIFCSVSAISQTDTLHINYDQVKTIPHDTSLAKMDAWVKKLNGMHVDVTVIAYYSKIEFKKYAQERADEMFLVLNRKARSLITIEFIGPKKGATSQRSRVDIVYKKSVSAEEKAAIAAAAAAEKGAASKAEKEKKDAEKSKVADEKKSETAKKEGAKESKDKTNGEKSTKGSAEKSSTAEKKPEKKSPEKKVSVNGSPGTKSSKGDFVTLEEANMVKNAKLIVPRTDDPEFDSLLTLAVKGYWNYNTNISYGTMSYDEAKKLAKTDKNVLIFIISNVSSKSSTFANHDGISGNAYRYISNGYAVMLENGAGKPLISCYFPTYLYEDEEYVGVECLAFAVSELNSIVYNMEKYNIKNNTTFNKPFKQNASRLKDKVLYIPEDWISDKLDRNEIPNLYEGKFKVVDYKTWSEAIINKKNVAYIIVVPIPRGGQYVYLHYMMDASTGDVLFISQPAMAVNVAGFNVSKANTGYINSKTIKNCNDAFHIKIDEDDKDEKAQGKDNESSEKKDEAVKEEASKNKESDSPDKAAKEKEKADKKAAADAEKEAKKAEEKKKKEEEAAKKAENEAQKKKEKEEKEAAKKK